MGMKSIADIYEKLSIDSVRVVKGFPIDGTLDDIADFLRKNDFKEVHEPTHRKLYNYGRRQGKVFLIERDWNKECRTNRYGAIFFADTSEGCIDRGNPLYCVYCEDPNVRFCDFDYHHFVGAPTNSEFLEAINERFGW